MAPAVLAGRRPSRAPADALIAGGVVVAALALALFTATKAPSVAGGNPLVLTPFVALPIWMFLTERYTLALAVLLLYLGLVDGFIKLKVGTELPTAGRDLLMYALAIGMLLRAVVRRESMALPPLSAWVAAFVVVVLVQLLNPANQSVAHSLAALRQHIEFVPLFFIGYTVMRSKDRLRGFFLLILVVASVNGAVALVQFNMTPDQLANWGPGYANLINGEGAAPRTRPDEDGGGSRVRPPGLGSDMGFAGRLGAMALPGALALLALGRFNRRHAIWAALLAPGAVIGVVASQARSVVVLGVCAVVVFALLAMLAGQALRLLVGALAVLVLAIGAVSFVGDQSSGAFDRYSSVAPNQLLGTTIDARAHTLAAIPVYAERFPLGAGIGSVGPASGFLGTSKPLNAESQFTFMIIELGVLGLLVFLAFQARILGVVLTRLRRLEDPEERLLLVALVTPLVQYVAVWVIGVTTTSAPNAPYLWFASGTALWWVYRRRQRWSPSAT